MTKAQQIEVQGV